MTMYFMPVSRASLAQSLAGNGFGLNFLASGAYSETGMPSFSITHSCRPIKLYKPQWMNMPKRASCHHFIRRARSASLESGFACAGVEFKRASEGALSPLAPRGSIPAARAVPVPIIQPLREIRLSRIRFCPFQVVQRFSCRKLKGAAGGLASAALSWFFRRFDLIAFELNNHNRRHRIDIGRLISSVVRPASEPVFTGAPSASWYARLSVFFIAGIGKGTRGSSKKVKYNLPGLAVTRHSVWGKTSGFPRRSLVPRELGSPSSSPNGVGLAPYTASPLILSQRPTVRKLSWLACGMMPSDMGPTLSR